MRFAFARTSSRPSGLQRAELLGNVKSRHYEAAGEIIMQDVSDFKTEQNSSGGHGEPKIISSDQ